MTTPWAPGVQYGPGSIVQHDGQTFKLVQPHTSQPDWTPSLVPALWHSHAGDKSNSASQSARSSDYVSEQTSAAPKSSEFSAPIATSLTKSTGNRQSDARSTSGTQSQSIIPTLNSANYNDWLQAARVSTEAFHATGPKSPATWILTESGKIPSSAINIANGRYACRAFCEDGVALGSASSSGASVVCNHKFVPVDVFEILVGDIRGLRWVSTHGKLDTKALGYTPVEGGRHVDTGRPSYVSVQDFDGDVLPGVAEETNGCLTLGDEGRVKSVADYKVLCYV